MLKKFSLFIMLFAITQAYAKPNQHVVSHSVRTHKVSDAKTFDPNAELVKTAIAQFMKDNNIPGVAVEMYVDGKPRSYYFGYADVEDKKPITKNTIFEVGSITKLMTRQKYL